MKAIILSLILLASTAISALDYGIRPGISTGMQFNSNQNKHSSQQNGTTTLFVSLQVEKNVSENTVVGTGITYNQRGCKPDIPWKLDYIDIPMTIGYQLISNSENSRLKPFIGIVPSLLINNSNENINLKPFDFLYSGGIKITLQDYYIAEVSYSESIISISKESDFKSKNRTVRFGIGTSF